jgi:hypothetical protein
VLEKDAAVLATTSNGVRWMRMADDRTAPVRGTASRACAHSCDLSGGLGDGPQVPAAEAAQVLGVDGLRLLLRQVAEAPVARVGLPQRVVGRAQTGAVVLGAQLLLRWAGLQLAGSPGGEVTWPRRFSTSGSYS